MQKKYLEIKDYLLERIRSGEFKPDQAIPAERELAAQLGVSRMTVRKAIEELMYEGLLIRRKGSGTFLTTAKSSKPDLLVEAGENAVKIISCKLCSEGSYGYKMLNLDPSRSYWRLRRVRWIGRQPYAYEDIYFHPDFFSNVGREFYTKGLSQMAAESGYPDLKVYEDVEALLCLHNTALLLKVETGSAILQIKSYFSSADRMMIFCRSYHPGDSYKYQSLPRSL